MILGEGVVGLALFALWLFCLVDVLTTPDAEVRNLPKLAWLVIVLLLSVVGSIAWLVLGRRQGPAFREYRSATVAATSFPEYDRPGRAVATAPDDDAAFLAQVRARAEAQRREYELRRRAEQAEEENRQRGLRRDGPSEDPREEF